MAKVFRRLFPKHITDPMLQQAALSQEIARVRGEIRRDMPDNLLLKGYKIYSQTDEDGIIEAIFERIGGGRTFIEIGSGNGTENNTHALLLRGWRGVWVDGRADRIAFVRSEVGPTPDLLAEQAFVTRSMSRPWLRTGCGASACRTSIFSRSTSMATTCTCCWQRLACSGHG